jgi:hypothetical protein
LDYFESPLDKFDSFFLNLLRLVEVLGYFAFSFGVEVVIDAVAFVTVGFAAADGLSEFVADGLLEKFVGE